MSTGGPALCPKARSIERAPSINDRAAGRRVRPWSLSSSLLPTRSNSGTLSPASNSRSAALVADWDRGSFLAASAVLPEVAMARKISSWRSVSCTAQYNLQNRLIIEEQSVLQIYAMGEDCEPPGQTSPREFHASPIQFAPIIAAAASQHRHALRSGTLDGGIPDVQRPGVGEDR